jgi:hypothetical protein
MISIVQPVTHKRVCTKFDFPSNPIKMKNTFTLLFLFVTLSVYSQQQKGDLSIQFSGNYFSQRIKFSNYSSRFGAGSINVKVGKFFTDNLELGVKPFVTFTLFTEPPVTTGSDRRSAKTTFESNVGVGLYGAYSYLLPSTKFLVYGGAEINYSPVDEEATINLGPYVGGKYFITERVNLDANLSWLINLGSTYETPKDEYEIRPLINFNIGVGVLLGRLND